MLILVTMFVKLCNFQRVVSWTSFGENFLLLLHHRKIAEAERASFFRL